MCKQTYPNLEIIVVDDGSTDKTVEVAKEILSKYHICYSIYSIPNGGVANARNYGLTKIKGAWVTFLDSDDYVCPSYIERLLTSAMRNHHLMAFCQYKNVLEHDIFSPPKFDKGDISFNHDKLRDIFLNRTYHMILPGMILHKDLFQDITFDIKCPYSEDTLITWELIYRIDGATCVNSDLYNYLIRPGSKQHSLTIDKYCQSIIQYRKMVRRIEKHAISNDMVLHLILPKFILSASHVLARCVSYDEFQIAYKQSKTKGFLDLIRYGDLRLKIYTLIYLLFPRIFYYISKK